MRKVIEHFMIRSALADLNDFSAWEDVPMSLPKIGNVIHFQPCGSGEDDIGKFRSGRNEKVGYRHEFYLFQRPIYLFGMSSRQDRIGADEKEHFYRIGLLLEYRIPNALGIDDGKPTRQSELVTAQSLGPLFL